MSQVLMGVYIKAIQICLIVYSHLATVDKNAGHIRTTQAMF